MAITGIADDELVRRGLCGDQQAFTDLFNRYAERSLRLAYTITGDRTLSEDATQEAFIKAFCTLRNIRPGSPFGPWFYEIVANRARRLAVRRNRRLLPAPLMDTMADVAAQRALDTAERGEVWHAVRRLPVDLRIVVALRYTLDLTESEVAGVLRLPLGTVKSRMHRARARLKRELRSDGEDLPDAGLQGKVSHASTT